MTVRRTIGAVVVAVLATVGSLAMAPSAGAQETIQIDLAVLTPTSAGNPEVWSGPALSLASGQVWTLELQMPPWGLIIRECGRFGTWRLSSATNPGDFIAGTNWQAYTGEVAMAVTHGGGRYASVTTGNTGGFNSQLVPIQQIGGPCWTPYDPLGNTLTSLVSVAGSVPWSAIAPVAGLSASLLGIVRGVVPPTLTLGQARFTFS